MPCPEPATSQPRGTASRTCGFLRHYWVPGGEMEPREPCLTMSWSPRTRLCALRKAASRRPCAKLRGIPLEAAARPTPRPSAPAPPEELITLNPVSYHFSASHSRLGALPRPLPLSLLLLSLPLFPSFLPPFTKHKLFLRLELFISTPLTLTHSLAHRGHSAASTGHPTAQRCRVHG